MLNVPVVLESLELSAVDDEQGCSECRGTRISSSKRTTMRVRAASRASDSPETISAAPHNLNGLAPLQLVWTVGSKIGLETLVEERLSHPILSLMRSEGRPLISTDRRWGI